MTQSNNLTTRPIQFATLVKPMLLGAAIGLVVISFFVFGARPNPAWGKYWMVRPLIITPLAGAGGGLFAYLMDHFLGYQGGWKKITAILISFIAFMIALWLGTVLGLAGTMWN